MHTYLFGRDHAHATRRKKYTSSKGKKSKGRNSAYLAAARVRQTPASARPASSSEILSKGLLAECPAEVIPRMSYASEALVAARKRDASGLLN